MSVTTVLLALAAAAGVPYWLWSRHEHGKKKRARALEADLLELGEDLVPSSIHPEIQLDDCIGSGACVRACPEHDVLAITDGRARLINPLACVGHGACLAACPVGAIKLVFGTATRGVELPRVSPSFETTRAGIYVVGELGGMGLIRNAIEQGRQAADAIARSGRRGGPGELDAIVVGTGPAGIAATLGLVAHGLTVLAVEQDRFGGTIRHYPRSKVVMTGTLELPGYGRVRRRTMSKEDLIALWDDIRGRTSLPIKEGVRVEEIAAAGGAWRVRAVDWEDVAATVVLALGRRGAPRRLDVDGEELPHVAYRVTEPEPFAGKRVLVVGGGNAAADCALGLAASRLPAEVALSYRRPVLARLRGSVRARIEEAFARRTIVPYLETEVVAIAPEHVALRGPGGVREVAADAVVVQIGGTSPRDLLHGVGIELVEKRGEA
jgi:thioredoxin reductase/NAD-dependent dihydropyrimidine dehydrogenase PreA subunit